MAETKAAAPKQVYLGTGRRKSSRARVRVTEGTGKIEINGRSVEDYFSEDKDRNAVYAPLLLTDMRNRLDVRVTAEGGGFTGQSGAILQGLSRALKLMFSPAPGEEAPKPAVVTTDGQPAAAAPDTGPIGMQKKLRDSGFLTRDGRMKERKKYGRKGARRSFQFSKR
jgi:small subunit ribosomal protein S9